MGATTKGFQQAHTYRNATPLVAPQETAKTPLRITDLKPLTAVEDPVKG